MKTLAVRAAVTFVACASAWALFAPAAGAVDVHAYANGCYALRDAGTDRFVVRDALGYAATARAADAATPFRLQATALGRYLLYGPDGRMPSAGLLDAISPTATPGPVADWRVIDDGGTLRLTNVSTGRHLGVGALGRLVQVASTNPRWSLAAAQDCATFPEVEVNVTGQPFKGPNSKAKVRGFVDDHIHLGAFRFLSGGFHCGRPWSPYGVTVAMRDCADHYPNGEAAVVENFLSTGGPNGTHSPEGWPSFAGWPRDESLTHEGTYWKWIERAWRSGLRIMVNDLVENRALCELYPIKQDANCNEMASAYEQAEDMHALQDYIDAQFGGPGKGFLRIVKTPAEARKVINAGKLAMVLGVEVSEILDCGQFMDIPRCTPEQIDAELDRLQSTGVVSLFPIHKFDNALGGVKFDSGTTGVLVNTGNKYATGKFWTAEHCDDPDHDNEPTNPTGEHAETFYTLFGPVVTQPLFEGQLPVYPPAPLCNPRGLTALGEHLIRSMMRRGMIIETDHMSMRARRETLTILESEDYPGVVSSHSWGDPGSQKRIQRLGGLIGPISHEAHGFAEEWLEARANRDPRFFFGLGFGSDINGLHAQPVPRADAAQNPVRYPFRSFDGDSVIDRQRSGTRTYDINTDGVDHYGLYADWVEDLRLVAGPQIVDDLANGAEAYLRLWDRAEKAARH
ncbi:MAG: Coagulation factor 5/8 type domain-containing protein [Solirubrobacterales bacterium]